MKIFVINGGPRKNGVTYRILKAIESGISKNNTVDWVDVYDLSMRPCIGCLKCRPDKDCIFKNDDAYKVGNQISSSDFLIVGSPTYWGNMTGPLKTLFDRNVPKFEYVDGINIKKVNKGKNAIIVVTSAAPFPFNLLGSQSKGAVRSIRTVLKSGGFKITATLNIPGTATFENSSDRVLNKAKRLGEKIL